MAEPRVTFDSPLHPFQGAQLESNFYLTSPVGSLLLLNPRIRRSPDVTSFLGLCVLGKSLPDA